MPPEIFEPLMDSGFGLLILDRWLDILGSSRDPFYFCAVIFIALFSIGGAIWGPRLMQFTARIAPPNKKGSYIALSYLPLFLDQFLAGPMSEFLLATYLPSGSEDNYSLYYMVWVWIGAVGAINLTKTLS